MRAVRLMKWQSEPVVTEVPEPEPGPGQVVVKVGGAGACHSDLHVSHAESMPGWSTPFTLGHETAGWVHAVGEGVDNLAVGTAVAVYGPWGCGLCARCRTGAENYCEGDAPVKGGGAGLGADGGIAEYILVPHARLVVPLPDGLDPVQAAPLTDAGLTPYHVIRRSRDKLLPGSVAVVIGTGGLGHIAVQILKAITSAKVIAIDSKPAALDLARECGADVVIPAGTDAAEAVRAATVGGRGADLVIDFVGATGTLELAVKVARQMADVTIVGAANGTLPWNFFAVPYEVSLQTTYWGTIPELAELLELAAAGLVRPKVTTFPLEEAPEVYRRLDEGKLEGRAVFIP
ncbi:NAD(P)-dependent alcohol dehydrogenase [Actinoplanes couchii]|uniref:alcohol dehydrogenase n=1 Tax=Actinoplanes couchii TaxID=403638 RepID=A0ABQ3WZN6_9ACTN|nr:NAD(P)-dependent alcohol dehydrogenase [Actinoplanes couchii]MDR6316130.1 propanol-preferring alcohol dehydrogenase [Actinoplanes couchii]GID51745.1 oxidoreductase [Actinoplanes couchii]